MKRAFLFSGQGSQYVGMVKDLAEGSQFAADMVQMADSVLDRKLSDICFEGPLELLKETRNTQPAIFLHSAIVFNLLRDRLIPDCVAGHSVGEYAALYAAGVLKFEDALKLVALRGELMFRAGETLPGTMFAVIGLDDIKAEEIAKELTLNGNGNVVVPANYNSPGQLVVSGSAEYLRENAKLFKEAGAKMVTELVVSGAFHSPLMLPAKEELEKAIENAKFNDANIPVYSNVYAKALTGASDIKKALIEQLTSPVKWTQSLIAMNADGADEFYELGPGKVLQGLVKRTLQNIAIDGVDKFEDLNRVLSR